MFFFLLGKSFLKLFATKLPLEMMHMTFILIKTLLFDLWSDSGTFGKEGIFDVPLVNVASD